MLKTNNERCIELNDDGNDEDTTTATTTANNNKNLAGNMNDMTAMTTVHAKITPSIHLAPLSTLISAPTTSFSPPVLVVDDDEPSEETMESSEIFSSDSRKNITSEVASVSGISTSTTKAHKDQTNTMLNQQQQKQLIKVAGPQQRQLSLLEKKRLRQQNPVEKIFPHIAITHQKLRVLLAPPICGTLQQQLLKVINAYMAGCRNEYEEGTSLPYKCRRLAHSMTRTMDLMQQICAAFEDTPEYIHRMIELVAIYLSCELRYAKEFKEHKPLIANRILHNIYKYLKGSNKDETMTYILRMFAHMPRMYREREVMTKIFQTLIPMEQVIIQRELPDNLYIQYIIVFYHWKQLELNPEEQIRVIEFANKFMRPAKTLCTNSTYAYHLPNYTCTQTATKIILHDLKFFHDLRNASIYDHRLQLGTEVIDICDEDHPKSSNPSVNVDFAELVQHAEIRATTRPMVKLENQIVIATIDLTLEDKLEDDVEWLQELQRNAKKLEPARNALTLLTGRNSNLTNENSTATSDVIEIDSDTENEEDNDELEEPENLLLEEPEQLSDPFLHFEEPDQDDNLSENDLEDNSSIAIKSNKSTDQIKPTSEEPKNDTSSSLPFSQQPTQEFPTKLNIISVRSIAATQTESNSDDFCMPTKSKAMPELLPAKPNTTEMRSIAATQTENIYCESANKRTTDAATQFLPSKPTIIEVRSIAKNQSNNNTPLATSSEPEATQVNPQIYKTPNADLVNESSKQAVTSVRNDIRVSRTDESFLSSCRRDSLHLLSSPPIRTSVTSNENNDTINRPDIDTNSDDDDDDDDNDDDDEDEENDMGFFNSTPYSRMGMKTTVSSEEFNSNKVIYSVAASICPPLQRNNTDFLSDDESPNFKQQIRSYSAPRNNVTQKKLVKFSNKIMKRTGGAPVTHPIKPAIKNTNSTYNSQHATINSAVSRFGSASPASSTSSLPRSFQKGMQENYSYLNTKTNSNIIIENKTDTDNLIISTQPTSDSLKLSSNDIENDNSNMSVLNKHNDAIVNENQAVSKDNNNQHVESLDKENLTLTQAVDISSTNFNELSVTSTCDELCAASQDVIANTEHTAIEAADAADSQLLHDVAAEQTTKEQLNIEEQLTSVVAATNSPETSINWHEEDKSTYYDLEEFLILHKRRESHDITGVNHNADCNLSKNSNTNTSNNNECELDSDLEFDFDFVFGLDFDAMTPTTAATVAAANPNTTSLHTSTTSNNVDGYNVEADKLLEQFNVATENIVETVLTTSELPEPPISSPTLTSTCNNNNNNKSGVCSFSTAKRTSAISSTTSASKSPESLAVENSKIDDLDDDDDDVDNVELPLELENELLMDADDDLLPPSELITDAELLKEFVTIPTMISKSPKSTTETKLDNVDPTDLLQDYVAMPKKSKNVREVSVGKGKQLPKTEDLLKALVANKAVKDGVVEELCELKNLSESSLGASNDVLDNAELLQEFVMIPTVSTKSVQQKFEASNEETAGSNTEIEDDDDLLQAFQATTPKIKAKTAEFSLSVNSMDLSETSAAEETNGASAEIAISGPESSHFEESLDEAYAMSRRVLMRNLMSATHCSAFSDAQQVEITLPLKKRRKISEFQDELEANSNAAATLTEEEEEDELTTDIIEKNTVAKTGEARTSCDAVSVQTGAEEFKANDADLSKPLEATANSSTVANTQTSSATQPKPILLPTNSSPPQNKQVQIVAPQIKEHIKPIDALITPLAESYPAEPMLSIANFENLVHLQRYLDTLVTSTHISKTIDAALAVTHIFQEFSGQGSHSTLIATIEKLLSTPSALSAEENLGAAADNGKLLLKIHLEGSISILVDNNNVSEWMKLPPATAALLTKAAKSLSTWEKYKQQQQIEQNKLLCEQTNSTKSTTHLLNPADDEDEQILEIRAHDLINKMLPGQRNVPLPKKENMLFDLQMAELRIKQQNDAPNVATASLKDTQNTPAIVSNFKDGTNIGNSITMIKDVQTAAVAPLETSTQQATTDISSQTMSSAAATPAPTPTPAPAPTPTPNPTPTPTPASQNLSSASVVVSNPIMTTTKAQQQKATLRHDFVDQHVAKIIEAQKLYNPMEQSENAQNSISSKDLETMNMRYYDGSNASYSSNADFRTAAKHTMSQYTADDCNECISLNPSNRDLVNLNCPPRNLNATQLLKHAAHLSSSKYLRHNSNERDEKRAGAGVGMLPNLFQQQNDLFQQYNSNNFCAEQQQPQPHIASSYQEIYQHTQTYAQSSNFANLQQMQFPTLLHSPTMSSESTVEAAETIDISQLKLPYTKVGDYPGLINSKTEPSPSEFQSIVLAEKRKQFEEIIKQRDIVLQQRQQQQQQQRQRDFEEQQRRSADYEAFRLSYKDDLMLKSNKEQNQRHNPHRQRYLQQQQLEYEKLHNKAKHDFEELQRKKLQYEWLQEYTARHQQQQQQFQQQLTASTVSATASNTALTLSPSESAAEMAAKRRRLEECHSNNLTLNMITDMNQTAKSIAGRGRQNILATPAKRGRGRPRKYPLATEETTTLNSKPVPSTRGRGRSRRYNHNAAAGKSRARRAAVPPATLVPPPTMTQMTKTCTSNMLLYPAAKAINTNAHNAAATTTAASLYHSYGGIYSAPVNSLDVPPPMITTCCDLPPLSQNI